MTQQRRKAFQWGLRAERIAALWLWMQGYAIVARRWKCPFGEIDLIVRRGSSLVFVEVKARAAESNPAEIITPRSQARIVRAAQAFISSHPWAHTLQPRFDVIVMNGFRLPRHWKNAWGEDTIRQGYGGKR